MAADAAVLEGHAYTLTDGVVDLGDGSVEAIVAAQAAAQALIDGSANETKPELAATYTLSDSLANIMDPANADMVTGAGSYALTDVKADLGEVTVAGREAAQLAAATAAQAVIAGATNASELGDLSYTFVLNDTVANIQALSGTLPEGATGYILTDTVENISNATAQFVGAALNYMLSDSIENILEAPAGILAGHTYELTSGRIDFGTDLSIEHVRYAIAAAQSVIDGSTNAEKPALDADYTINDTVANVTANDDIIATHSYSLTDTSASIDAAASALLTNATTVAVEDTLANIAVSSVLSNSEVDTVAADVNADTTISVATLVALSNKVTLDASVASAVTVDASTNTTGAVINLAGSFTIAHESEALTFNALGGSGADTITAHANGGIISGGKGADTMTADSGIDTFAFKLGDSGAPSDTNFDEISSFGISAGTQDKIDFDIALKAGTASTVAAEGTAQLAADGKATFHANDSSVVQMLTAVAGALAAQEAGSVAWFVDSGATYVFVSDGTTGVTDNDVLIKLTGTSATAATFDANGDMTFTA